MWLVVILKDSYIQMTPVPIDQTWFNVYRQMRLARDDDINFRSSCPWYYLQDEHSNQVYPVLFNVVKTNCIDLDRSTAEQLYLTMNGVCTPVIDNCSSTRRIVGYTCMKPVGTESVKRSEWIDPWVKPAEPTSPISSVKPFVSTKKDDDIKGDDLKPDISEKPTTPLHQNFAPPFLNNENNPFFSPGFMMNGGGQFQPGFLNSGMNPQMGQPPLMLQFGVTQANRDLPAEQTGESKEDTGEPAGETIEEITQDVPDEGSGFLPDNEMETVKGKSSDPDSEPSIHKRHWAGNQLKTIISKRFVGKQFN